MTNQFRSVRRFWYLTIPALAFGLHQSLAGPQDPAAKAKDDSKPKAQYIGAESCKLCHSRKSVGGQFKIWKEEKHSKAFESLASPEAKELGTKMGVSDPQKDERCLKCHVTGHGLPADAFAKTYKSEEGITCEACHGPASLYVEEANHTGEAAKSDKFGLLHPDEKTCVKCHNKDAPNYKEFHYDKSLEKIKHPVPKDKKAGK
jgi:hypothetical protein